MRGRSEAAVEIRPGDAEAVGIRPGARPVRAANTGGLAGVARVSVIAKPGVRRAVPRLRLLRSSRESADCTDGELVTLALNGAATAFSRLMRRHSQHLNAVIGRRLRNPEDARDAVQDTHLAVWRALRHYDAGRPFEAWITTIALNKCRDFARRRAAQLGMLSRLKSDAVREASSVIEERGIERLLIGRESMRCLGTALRALPPQLRAPLLLTTIRERSQEAAARELGLTRKAVEMRVRRARAHLAGALQATEA